MMRFEYDLCLLFLFTGLSEAVDDDLCEHIALPGLPPGVPKVTKMQTVLFCGLPALRARWLKAPSHLCAKQVSKRPLSQLRIYACPTLLVLLSQ
jgi:hypothetical protein